MPDTDRPTHYQRAEAYLASLPRPEAMDYADRVGAAQAHAILAAVDKLDELDTSLFALHQTLNERLSRGMG